MIRYDFNRALMITKEQLHKVAFSTRDALMDDLDKVKRKLSLDKSEKLGNNYKSKVKIYFTTQKDELLFVETTVWSVNLDNISLKAGATIPIHSIVNIEY
jgi:hypothetical protein